MHQMPKTDDISWTPFEYAFTQMPVPVAIFSLPDLVNRFTNPAFEQRLGHFDQITTLASDHFDLMLNSVVNNTSTYVIAEQRFNDECFDLHFSPIIVEQSVTSIMMTAYPKTVLIAPSVEPSNTNVDFHKLWTLVDNSIELMSILEFNGRNSYINKAGMKMLGFENFQEVLSTPISDLHTEHDIDFVQKQVIPSVMNTGCWSGQIMVRHKQTGEVFPVFNNTIRIDDPETGEPIAIGAVMRDMRSEISAEKAYRESEANFRNLVLQAPFAIAVLKGVDFVVELSNIRMMQLWGKSEAELMNRPVFEAIPEARGIGLEEKLSAVLLEGKTIGEQERELDLVRNGKMERIYVNYVYEPLREADGTIKSIIVVAIEVTEQVLARQKIEAAQEQSRLAIELADLGTYELDFSTDVVTRSPRFDEIFGLHPSATRTELAATLHPEDLNLRKEAHELSRKTGRLEYEARLIRPDKTLRWLRVRGMVTFDSNHHPEKLYGVVLDITEQKFFAEELSRTVAERTRELQESNSRLERSNAELEQFAYITSHDLQEPLRKIQVFNSMLSDKVQLNPQAKAYVEKIGDSARRMSGLIRDLLDYSRITKVNNGYEPVDLNQVIANVLSDFELMITQKNATIKVDRLEAIDAVNLQLNQLFFNLIGNALKFSRPDLPPVITITGRPVEEADLQEFPELSPARKYYEVKICDNGIGFDQHYANKIFTMFQQLNQDKRFGGYGIGLALCRKIVENHHGSIKAKGEHMEGAEFTVVLPVRQV